MKLQTGLWLIVAATSALSAFFILARGGEQESDFCKAMAGQDHAFRAECAYVERAKAATAELNGLSGHVAEIRERTENILKQLNEVSPPK